MLETIDKIVRTFFTSINFYYKHVRDKTCVCSDMSDHVRIIIAIISGLTISI